MKKLSALRVFTAMAIAACVFSSCKEDQTSLSVDSLPGKAKIMGRLVYNDGRTTTGSSSSVDQPAANTTVYLEIDNSSIKAQASGVTVRTTTTDADGYFECEIPTNDEGVDITIKGAPFEGVYYTSSTDKEECIYNNATSTSQNISSNDIISVGKITYSHTLLNY